MIYPSTTTGSNFNYPADVTHVSRMYLYVSFVLDYPALHLKRFMSIE